MLSINGREVLPPQDYLKFELNPVTTNEVGALYWDNQDNTLTVPLDGEEVKLQIGQETLTRCVNDTHATIPNGSMVYVSGVQGNRPKIALADANVYAQGEKLIGMATENISHGEYGYITTFGAVRDLNTDIEGYTEGDCLYLSETPGAVTRVKPTAPVPAIKIGMLLKKHATDGWIHVCIDKDKNIFGDYDNSNYTYFESGGTMVAVGTALTWTDIDFPIIVRTTGANIPTLATLQGNITAPQWEVNDLNVCEGQEFVHAWKEGSDVRWHIHMITNGLELVDKFVKWEVEWFWVNVNGQISASNTQSYEYTIPANTPDRTMKIVSIYTWTPTGGKIGGHCYARLRRIASTGAAPAANPFCTMLQLHIQCDTLGSRSVTAK